MKTQTFIFTIGILLIIGLAVFFINKPAVPDELQNNTETTGNAESTPEVTGMTAAEVATHNTEQDCRIIVGDKVYDVTPWIPKHPGGPKAILSLCGTDATALFTKQHGSNQNAQAALKSFFIADLTT